MIFCADIDESESDYSQIEEVTTGNHHHQHHPDFSFISEFSSTYLHFLFLFVNIFLIANKQIKTLIITVRRKDDPPTSRSHQLKPAFRYLSVINTFPSIFVVFNRQS